MVSVHAGRDGHEGDGRGAVRGSRRREGRFFLAYLDHVRIWLAGVGGGMLLSALRTSVVPAELKGSTVEAVGGKRGWSGRHPSVSYALRQ